MKNVLFYATAAFAATATINKRQASVIADAVGSVSASVSALNDAVTAFNSVNQVADLEASASSVNDAITAAQSTIEPLDTLTQSDAITLAQPISDLADLVEASVQNVISKRSTFDQVGVSPVVLSTLTQLRDSSKDLSDTILSKIPQELSTVGQGLAARISSSLDEGVQAYSDASGSSAPTSGSVAPTSGSVAPTSGSVAPTSAPTGGAYTTSRPAATTAATTGATRPTSSVAVYPGVAGQNAASGFGAAAMAALAVAAML